VELDTFILDLFSMRIVNVMATHRSPVSTASGISSFDLWIWRHLTGFYCQWL